MELVSLQQTDPLGWYGDMLWPRQGNRWDSVVHWWDSRTRKSLAIATVNVEFITREVRRMRIRSAGQEALIELNRFDDSSPALFVADGGPACSFVYTGVGPWKLYFERGRATWLCRIGAFAIEAVYIGRGNAKVTSPDLPLEGIVRGARSSSPWLMFSGLVYWASAGSLCSRQRVWSGGLIKTLSLPPDLSPIEREEALFGLLHLCVTMRYVFFFSGNPRI